MDFLDPKKRKAHIRRLYIGYVLVGIAIGLGALILLFASFGYGFDRRGNLVQKGLVFLSSTPNDSQVNISNQAGNFEKQVITDERLELKADTYNFQFLKQGYKPWQNSFDLRGGSILRLVYPFLVPETLRTDVDEAYAQAPGLVTQTPDRKTALVQQSGSLTNFQVFDTNDLAKEPTTFAIPANLLPANSPARAYQLVEWSTNNRHLLVRYEADTGPIFLVIDRENPDESRNINTYFSLTPTKVSLRDKNPGKFYMTLPDKRLVSAQTSNREVLDIAGGVIDFKPHGDDDILYVTTDNAKPNKALAMVRSKDKTYQVRELSLTDKYVLDIARYKNDWYIVVGASNEKEAYIYRDPALALEQTNNAKVTIRTIRLDNPQRAGFSANSRFIAFQNGSNFVVYDAELDEQHRFTVNPNFDDPNAVRWMDGHRLMGSTNGNVLIIDFDGTNQQTLSAIVPGTEVMFDDNYEQLNTLAPQPTGQALTNTPMRVQ